MAVRSGLAEEWDAFDELSMKVGGHCKGVSKWEAAELIPVVDTLLKRRGLGAKGNLRVSTGSEITFLTVEADRVRVTNAIRRLGLEEKVRIVAADESLSMQPNTAASA